MIKTVELLFANLAISARTMCILALFPTRGLLSALLNWDASDCGVISSCIVSPFPMGLQLFERVFEQTQCHIVFDLLGQV